MSGLENLPYVLIIFAAFLGVLLTIYIYNKKRRGAPMVCPLNGHCESVINSEFSKFLGIPVELIGMLYYSVVAVSYAIFLVLPFMTTPLLTVAVFLATVLAFLFSVYLVFIQIFYLRQICTWCLGSAALCTAIFGFSLYSAGGIALGFILPYIAYVLTAYEFGLAVGLGSALFSIIFLTKFLRDLRLSTTEVELLRAISQVGWLSLALVFITGTIAFLAPAASHDHVIFSPIQIVILIIMIGAGAIADLLLVPHLITISQQEPHEHQMGELHMLRKSALLISFIVFASWIVAFVLGTIQRAWDFTSTGLVYAGIVLIAMMVSQFIERRFGRLV